MTRTQVAASVARRGWTTLRWSMIMALGVTTLWSGSASAEPPVVVTVPYAPNNLNLPHPVHEHARITLKGILRDATCDAGYRVTWDANRNGNFDDDASLNVIATPNTDTVYDIGQIFEVPPVDRGKTLTINVRATSLCDPADEGFGTYRLYVYDWTPSSDPTRWTQDQLDTMSSIAVRESLWWLHRQVTFYSGSEGRIRASHDHIRGSVYKIASNASMMWAMSVNGHLPAFPIDEDGGAIYDDYGMGKDPDWEVVNAHRWENDPYAETMMRVLNWSIREKTLITDVPSEDEDTTCGYDEAGIERHCDRIEGTTNEKGALFPAGALGSTYLTSITLGSLATLLPALGDLPIQEAPLARDLEGHTYRWFVQELVDWIGRAQHDGGCGLGSYIYLFTDGDVDCGLADSSAAQWAFIGLESSEIAGGPYGIIVNNRHKYRSAVHLITNQADSGSAAYRSNDRYKSKGDFQLTGGSIVGLRWLDVHTMDPAGAEIPYLDYAPYTEEELYSAYTEYLAFTARNWERDHNGYGTPSAEVLTGSGAVSRLFQDGDYLCGQPLGVYNAPGCGNSYALYSHQKGYRTGLPELLNVGGHDWVREFTTYYVRAQSRYLDGYLEFGRIEDQFCVPYSYICNYAGATMATAWGTLVMTPTLFRPKPIPIAQARPNRVIEGCAGGGAGLVRLDHSNSFHPNRDAFIAAFQWDVDDSDGLWWETGAAPDYIAVDRRAVIQHTYQTAGTYNATLRVVENDLGLGEPFEAVAVVRVVVETAPNVAPGVVAGGPYILERGEDLVLEGVASDANIDCGDSLTVGWDFNDDGLFDDFDQAQGIIPAAFFDGFVDGQEYTFRIQATDSSGLVDTDETTVVIFASDPVAVARVNPQPAACRQVVRFDGAQSFHPNPEREIVNYAWDVDSNEGVDGGGVNPEFSFTYPSFGVYRGSLTVTDNRGRTHSVPLEIDVTEGNHPPTARTTQPVFSVSEGDPLTLDATPSSDPDGRCGDGIVSYEWDLDNNGVYGEASDANGMRPIIPWARLSQMNWPADRNTLEPTNTIRLRVTDTRGVSAEVESGIRIFLARPVANFVQRPDPAPVQVDNGLAEATLDARDSYSPIPGLEIARYDWDLDDDGVFEIQNRPVVNFAQVFWPLPERGEEPEVFVRLRVTDPAGRVNNPILRQQVRILVPPTEPTVDPDPREPGAEGGVGYHILEGEGVTLDGSDSFDPDLGDRIIAFRWDLDGDGEPDVIRIEGDGQGDIAVTEVSPEDLAALGLDQVGAYTVTLEVEDLQGLTNQGDAPFVVHPRDPVARASANPNPTACGGQVSFDGDRSSHSHPDINIVAWRWDLNGDGVFEDAAGSQVNFRFEEFTFDDPIVVGLEVEDSRGHTGRLPIDIFVTEGNQAPSADAGSTYAIPVGADLQLDGSGSEEPNAACGDEIVAYRWDLNGDGAFDLVGQSPIVPSALLLTYGIDQPGQHPVTLEVEDRFGRVATDEARVWVVAPPVAVARASEAVAVCNQLVEFDGTASTHDGPDGGLFEIVEYAWDMNGDGIFERNGSDISQPIVAREVLEATLRVTDGFGRTDLDTVSVNVNIANLRPDADAGGPYVTGIFNGSFVGVDLDGRSSSDSNAPCDQIVEYWWDTDNDDLYGPDDVDGAGSLVGSDYVGPIIRDYTNPGWQVGTTQVIHLKTQDSFGEWSEVSEAEIRVRAKIPPTGEILTPRAGECVGGDVVNLVYDVRQPGGGLVEITAYAGETLIGGPVNKELPPDGSDIEDELPLDVAGLEDGLINLTLHIVDDEGEEHIFNAGGNVTLDRQRPDINIGAMLVDGACYDPNGVPDVQVQAVDNLDPAVQVEREVVTDACQRELRVTATDACGNTRSATRAYFIAERVDVQIHGADENSVVPNARLTWDLLGPALCVSGVVSSLTHNGGPAVPYAENSLVEQAGQYALNLGVSDCLGRENPAVRNFMINAPPVPHAGGPYEAVEGDAIFLNAGNSAPPEEGDTIDRFDWDMNGDGVFELSDEVVAFTPLDDGLILGTLRVTDGQGATASTQVEVTVTDIDPVVVPGGPYEGAQGVPIEFDASGSHSLNPLADPITGVVWDFGDGTIVAGGAEVLTTSHAFLNGQLANVRLTISDEDDAITVNVPVEISDANPIIVRTEAPEDPFEIRSWRFIVEAEQGSEDDPLVDYEWNFNDGTPPVRGEDLTEVTHAWRDAGTYRVNVRIRDVDSETNHTFDVVVRPMTMQEAIELVLERVEAVDAGPLLGGLMDDITEWLNKGLWAEERGARGNTFVALQRAIGLMVTAQGLGAELDNSLWVLSRTLLRTVQDLRRDILTPEEGEPLAAAEHPSVLIAGDFIEQAEAIFGHPNFELNVSGGLLAIQANDLFRNTFEAFFYLQDAIDPCKAPTYNGFRMPEIEDILERALASNSVNRDLNEAMASLAASIQNYIDLGIDAPGRRQAIDALARLRNVQAFLGERIDISDCADRDCLSDRDALELLLQLMDLANFMVEARNQGAYVRNWQACSIEAVKFRTALSEMRMEFICGLNSQYVQEVKVARSAGLRLVDEGNVVGALDYFRSRDIRCLAIRGYNKCLVPPFPAVNREYPRPEFCPDEIEGPVGPGPGGLD